MGEYLVLGHFLWHLLPSVFISLPCCLSCVFSLSPSFSPSPLKIVRTPACLIARASREILPMLANAYLRRMHYGHKSCIILAILFPTLLSLLRHVHCRRCQGHGPRYQSPTSAYPPRMAPMPICRTTPQPFSLFLHAHLHLHTLLPGSPIPKLPNDPRT
ncbi:hypothetical protein EDC04DRAFT_2652031 [Pisolithus marmoratus]|nr:hypothetical protein EDC04DRAFT_2652031 [Pisolithus marmoratus]